MIFSTGRKHHAWVGDGKDERSLFEKWSTKQAKVLTRKDRRER
jgi:hypothetical protein